MKYHLEEKYSLFGLKSKLRYSKLGKKIFDCYWRSPASEVVYNIMDRLELTDGAHERKMKGAGLVKELGKSKEFFFENLRRIDYITEKLADAKSKEVFRKAIRYRYTLDIKDRPDFCIHDQYFPKGIIDLGDEEVFVDCGAYTGDICRSFVKNTRGRYKKIVAFEPDVENSKNINFQRCKVIEAGVWEKEGNQKFTFLNHIGSAKLKDTEALGQCHFESNIEDFDIKVQSIDGTPDCADATFIKMDIEGAEMAALRGARKTILRNRPKLAICIYHNDEDMLRIPEWIINLKLGYKLYIRHHFGSRYETVLYAV